METDIISVEVFSDFGGRKHKVSLTLAQGNMIGWTGVTGGEKSPGYLSIPGKG